MKTANLRITPPPPHRINGVYLPILAEFFRYVLVGGSAFVVDIGILYAAKTYIFYGLGAAGILIAAACGFIAGLIFNYIFSITFVFKETNDNVRKHKVRSFIIFTIIGVAGLGLTEFLMYAGISVFGQRLYLAVKVVTAGIVLIWNYGARKLLIFKVGAA
jgi:putative flippase GtrA